MPTPPLRTQRGEPNRRPPRVRAEVIVYMTGVNPRKEAPPHRIRLAQQRRRDACAGERPRDLDGEQRGVYSRAAVPAPAAQLQPREHGDEVAGPEPNAADRAGRPGAPRRATHEPLDDETAERPKGGSERRAEQDERNGRERQHRPAFRFAEEPVTPRATIERSASSSRRMANTAFRHEDRSRVSGRSVFGDDGLSSAEQAHAWAR